MKIAFCIWSLAALLFVGIGISCLVSKKPVGFYANTDVPKVTDVIAYNRAMAILWFAFAVGFEWLGLPLLGIQRNDPKVVLMLLGVPFLVLFLVIAYTGVERRYRKK